MANQSRATWLLKSGREVEYVLPADIADNLRLSFLRWCALGASSVGDKSNSEMTAMDGGTVIVILSEVASLRIEPAE